MLIYVIANKSLIYQNKLAFSGNLLFIEGHAWFPMVPFEPLFENKLWLSFFFYLKIDNFAVLLKVSWKLMLMHLGIVRTKLFSG